MASEWSTMALSYSPLQLHAAPRLTYAIESWGSTRIASLHSAMVWSYSEPRVLWNKSLRSFVSRRPQIVIRQANSSLSGLYQSIQDSTPADNCYANASLSHRVEPPRVSGATRSRLLGMLAKRKHGTLRI